MKIHQLPMGARFEYDGEEYVKTGPLVGAGKSGQRLIPKYAVLKVAGTPAASADPRAAALDRQRVGDAFDAFFATCSALVPEAQRGALRDARAQFLRAID